MLFKDDAIEKEIFHIYPFSQNDNGVLCDACSNLWESS